MALDYDIEIQVAGPEHRGKTTLIAYLSKLLTEAGADLIVQRADSQIEEKFALSVDELRDRIGGKKIFLREVQHFMQP
jgi:hypothetical protein